MDLDEKVDSKNDDVQTKKKSSKSKGNSSNNSGNAIRYADFDVNKYASHYKGKTLVDRLLHIADINKDVKGKALQRALKEAEKGINVDLYANVSDLASKHFGGMSSIFFVFFLDDGIHQHLNCFFFFLHLTVK